MINYNVITPLAVLWAVGATFLCQPAPGAQVTPDTAAAGAQRYGGNCASCHGDALQGKFGPPLRGEEFRRKWVSDSTALLTYIKRTMPPAAPGSLSDDT